MGSTNIRNQIFPQMQDYDNMPSGHFVPYSMLSGPENFKSKNINTDRFGFRITKSNNLTSIVENINEYEKVNIILGGSTVFGVGSTNDSKTIASLLQSYTGEKWLNFGVRGCNSLQEYIYLISHLSKANNIKNIIFFSGINDLYLSLVNEYHDDYDYGFGTKFNKISSFHPYHQSFAVFFSRLYGLDYNDLIQFRKKEMIFPFLKFNKKEKEKLDFNKRIDRFLNQYQRNFKLYKGLKNSLQTDKVQFILQPLINWSNKNISKNEKKVLDFLNKQQKESPWQEFKLVIDQKEVVNKINIFFDSLSRSENIRFQNSNTFFDNENSDCFVDSVHLTDYGNKKIAEFIFNKL